MIDSDDNDVYVFFNVQIAIVKMMLKMMTNKGSDDINDDNNDDDDGGDKFKL